MMLLSNNTYGHAMSLAGDAQMRSSACVGLVALHQHCPLSQVRYYLNRKFVIYSYATQRDLLSCKMEHVEELRWLADPGVLKKRIDALCSSHQPVLKT